VKQVADPALAFAQGIPARHRLRGTPHAAYAEEPNAIPIRLTQEKAMPVKAGVVRAGSRNTRRGAAETFTGVVFQDPVVVAEAPSRMGGSVVTFTPGARTAWHAHPVGQTLYCLSGIGRICFEGQQPQVLNPGDVVNIPPDTSHWHGASPDRLFAHLALSEASDKGQGTSWGKHVTDAEYTAPASAG